MIFLWIVVTVLSLLVSICLMALVDQYQTLQLIRGRLELDDAPAPVVIPGDRVLAPSAIGLPAELDHREHLVVLFLSTTCATCRALAKKLGGRPPDNLWVVLVEGDAERAADWFAAAGLPRTRATVDLDGRISDAFGLDVTPAAFVYRRGEVLLGQTIPSFRQLDSLLSSDAVPPSLLP
ncbi:MULTISPECIES: TlpA family protein disulfide reductase [unclassified Streptomyces]|uniref:Thioredoxin domain-containing protein n=1 Tax=Streptomyces sp. NBC_00060 TaxID=2975636 RepID=A0AAU2H922_9ACTN